LGLRRRASITISSDPSAELPEIVGRIQVGSVCEITQFDQHQVTAGRKKVPCTPITVGDIEYLAPVGARQEYGMPADTRKGSGGDRSSAVEQAFDGRHGQAREINRCDGYPVNVVPVLGEPG